MTSGLAWLNELMLWLGKWFPRPVLVKATHMGVVFGRAGRLHQCAPGLYWYWPITTEFSVVSTRRRTFEIASQLCGREAVGLAVQYTIESPIEALRHFDDCFCQLDDRTQAHLSKSYAANLTNEALCDAVLGGLQAEFCAFGIAIHSVDITTRGRVIPLKNLNDWAQHAVARL